MFCFSGQKLYKILKGCFLVFNNFGGFKVMLSKIPCFFALKMFLSRDNAEEYAEKRGKKCQGIVFISLILAVFLLFTHTSQAAETSKFVPKPEITSFENGQILTGEVIIKGTSLNYSQVKIYLDNKSLGYTNNKIGTLGWQDFELQLPIDLLFGQHSLDLVTEYFNNTQSPTTTLSFYYQPKFPAPTLFDPVLNVETNYQQPWLVGLAFNNSYLEIYLDDGLDGKLLVANHESGVTSFKYLPNKKLSPGFHLVKARAVSPDNRISDWSNEIIFEVRKDRQILQAPNLSVEQGEFIPPVPAPTLVEPKNGSVTKDNKLMVTGVVHNEHYVKIYLDEKLVGEFMPETHPSGVTNFIWQSNESLDSGFHKIWARAINARGYQSGESNVLRFIVLPAEPVFVSQPIGKIAPAIAAEEPEVSEKIIAEEEKEEVSGAAEETKRFIEWKWWKILIIIVLTITILSVIIWLIKLRKKEEEKEEEEKVEIRTGEKKEEEASREEKKAVEEFDASNIIDEPFPEDEYIPPPPPPPDAPSLGI